MEKSHLLEQYDQSQRIGIVYPGMVKETLPQLVRFTRPEPNGRGFIPYAWLDESTAAGAIAGQVAHFSAVNMPFEWMICSHDPYLGLKQQLEAAGFEPDLDPGDPGAVLVLDLSAASGPFTAPIQADVRRVEQASQLRDVIRVLEATYGHNFDWIRDRLGAHLAIPGYLSVYLAYDQEKPVCAGWTYFSEGSQWGSLYGGATIPEQRRRGWYTAILAARVQEAIRRGRRYLVVYTGLESRPILEKHGFQLLTYACTYEWKPDKKGNE